MPLRVLQFETADTGWGGTEIHVVRLTEGLMRRGHTVGVVSAAGSLIERQAKALGAETIPFHLERRGEWRKLPALLRLIRRFRPDVVHAHTPVDLGLVSLASWLLRVPARVCTRHGIPRFSSARSAGVYGRLFHRFIAVSEFARRHNVERYGLPAERTVTIYPGLDVERYPDASGSPSAWRAETGVPTGAFAAALVGRMSEEKGHAVFLRALAQAGDMVGVLVGDGPLRGELERLAGEAGARVIWAGVREDVRPWLASADVVCVPSVKDEAMPWVLLEGMACGKPALVSTTGGLPEAVTCEIGIVFPNGDPTALCEALRHLRRDPARRREMGCAAREHVKAHFSLERMSAETNRLYQDVLQRR